MHSFIITAQTLLKKTVLCAVISLSYTPLIGQQSIKINKNINLELRRQIIKIDSLNDNLSIIQQQNTLIKKQLFNRQKDIQQLDKKLEKLEFNWKKDFIYPFPLSIISAIIFWLVFSFIPEKKRYIKLRPKVELDMYNVYTNLFFIFDTIMKPNKHSPSNFQFKIKGGKLTIEEINLGLQNKCQNETYLYDINIKNNLLPIGKELYELSSKIDLNIDRLFNFSAYLSSSEILILEKIRKKFQVYDLVDYQRDAATTINGIQLRPINPSLSYMSINFFELYQLYSSYQNIIFNNNFIDKSIFIDKVQYLYYSQQFRKCLSLIKNSIHNFSSHAEFLNLYIFQSEYNLGNKNKAYNLIDDILKNKPYLISYRNFIEHYLNNNHINTIIEKHYTSSEINELKRTLEQENIINVGFLEQANRLSNYFIDKSKIN